MPRIIHRGHKTFQFACQTGFVLLAAQNCILHQCIRIKGYKVNKHSKNKSGLIQKNLADNVIYSLLIKKKQMQLKHEENDS